MNRKLICAALFLSSATPALAQVAVNANDLTSQSASGAEANSGSISGASSDNQNANIQNGNVGVSVNENISTSNSGAVSGSNSESASNSDQSQGQSMGQDQGQSQSQGQSQDLDAAQANSQGVTFNQTWNTKNRKTTEIRTNNAVPLAASSSFSSDYCGGTVSGGASAAPLGISIGASGNKFDKSCQSLRRAEKFGMAAVNAMNMRQPDLAGKLMSMMVWSICTSDSGGPDVGKSTADACNQLLLLGSQHSLASAAPAQPLPSAAREAQVKVAGQITPEAATRALTPAVSMATNETDKALASTPK
jgi:hypothetical protein